MKNIRLTILFIWLSIFTVNAQINDAITFSINDLEIDTVGDYLKLSMPDCSYTDIIGYPELPRLEVRYVIPADKIVSDVIVSDSVSQFLQGEYLVFPHQPSAKVGDTLGSFVQPDSVIYSSNLSYPTKAIEIVDHYYEFGYHVVLLYVYPLVYNPRQRTLCFYTSISYSLLLSNNDRAIQHPKKESERMSELCKSKLKSIIRNANELDSNYGWTLEIIGINELFPLPNSLLSNKFDVIPEFLIITNNKDVNGNVLEPFENQRMTDIFQSFANWKTQKGVPAIVVTVDDISNNYIGNDVQAKIHNFLADVYSEFGSMYVLLGGDINIVPERVINMDAKHEDGIDHLTFATDLYYSAIESSWDSNLNGEYGETTLITDYNTNWTNDDNSDNYADFFLARMPVSNCVEAYSFINKTYGYEHMSGINPLERKYTNNIVALLAFLEKVDDPENTLFNNYMTTTNRIFGETEPVQNGIIQESIIKWRGFESKKNLNPSVLRYWMPMCKDIAISCFNSTIPISEGEKAHIILHCDHSSYQNLGTAAKNRDETLSREEVDLFDNDPFNKILISYGCSPGDFRKDCIIKHLLNNPNGGIVSAIASSTTSYTNESGRINSLLMKLYQLKSGTHIIQPIFYNNALIHNNSLGEKMLNFRKNHLFGDPELPIWTREPVELTVSTSPSIITNQNGQLTVNVSGMAYSEYSTNDVMVCVMKNDEIYLRKPYNETAHSHDFVFTVNPETAGELIVTVTGHNYIPYETTVPVNITGKNVYISEKIVMDEAGNADGNLDAGETDFLRIALKNNGTVNLTNVTATLNCEFLDESLNQNINDYLTIITATANYGNIAQNATVTRNNFQLTLSNAIPDQASLRCALTISDGNGIVCERSFTLSIGAPKIQYVSVRHEEKQNGRIGLDIELNNWGFGMAKGVAATLTSPSNVQITQGSATYGEMNHLEAKTESFEFISNGNIDNSSFSLTVTDAYNKSWSYSFILYDILDTIENLTFTNTEHSIKLKWDPVEDSRGYYIYRSMTADGNYERLNSYPVPSSAYSDLGLEVKQIYYYGVSYLDEYGNESEKARITTWTSLPLAEGWPINIPDGLGRAWGTAPNVADINGDGHKEIFLTTGTADNPGNMGAILGFNSLGEELYDIDHNPTTISGFANLGISMNCTPAIADIDNDNIMEIVVATRGNSNGTNHDLLVFKNKDVNNDGIPDLAWKTSLDTSNFNGVVLADLNNDGTIEIIAPNQGRQGSNTHIQVFDYLGDTIFDIRIPYTYNTDRKAVTMPIVADFDNDGYKEIVFGLEGGVYSWNSHNTPQLDTLVSYNQNNGGRTDCPVIATDIDEDGDLEILYMAIKNGNGYIRAINSDGTSVTNWNEDTHFVPLSSTSMDWAWPPYFCVADIDNDGSIEIFVADGGVLKMWKSDGTMFGAGVIYIPNLNCKYFQPVIADVDGNGDCEIIIPSKSGYIFAYKSSGDAVLGWPLAVVDLETIPAVTDIDGDGFNEVIAASQTELYVWHTEGESKYNHWDRFRYNKYNNAIYEVPCSDNEVPLEISNTQIWNDDRQIHRNIVINNCAHLTIKSELRFSEKSKIVVKPGGRLILDGGKLTNSCSGEMWPGIEVWGNRSQDQQIVNGLCAQGILELKNGAIIENAKCAVELWRPGYYSTTGGIIHANDATFRNNAKSVHALWYSNVSGGRENDYDGSFRNCSFIVDDDYLGTETFYKHVDLEHVNGISFFGCNFSAKRNVSGVSQYCMGIGAYETGFKVDSYCTNPNNTPCLEQDLMISSFTGFRKGIHVSNDGSSARAFNIKNSEFINNTCGIYALNSGYGTIVNNDFTIGCGSSCDFGIYVDEVSGFCIEDNSFHPKANNSGSPYGIEIVNSNGINDVYNNDFRNLRCGNVAVGVNHSNSTSGLTYSCNTNSGNLIDFCVLKDGNVGGIASQQGSTTLPAGNTFGGSLYHFYNDGVTKITYNYDSNDSDQTPNSSLLHRVFTNGIQSSNSCLLHYSGGGSVSKSASEKAALESEYLAARTTYNNLLQLYESRIDGGSTPTQVADINSAAPSDMWRLRAQLLGLSPYVSGEVLTTAADRTDLFTDPVLFEILAANPDELKKDSLISYLENKEYPLPSYMTDLLRQIASGFTARTALQSQMAQYRHAYSLAAGDIVRSCLNDSVTDLTELRTWLGNMDDIASDRMIIASYLHEGDSVHAFALANMLPELYNLQGDALDDHGDYLRLIGLYQTLYREGRTVFELTEPEIAIVNGIAEFGTGSSKTMAEALLEETGDYTRDFPCPTMPERLDGGRSRVGLTDASMNETMGFAINVSPNPATTWTTVDYALPANKTRAMLTVANTLGITVMSAELHGNQGQKVLDLRGLADGVYVFTVRCGEYSTTGKLIIKK